MQRKKRIFNETYQIDQATNLYMIEVALDQYENIFNKWDAAPFKRREIDPDLQLYLEESSNEIPFRLPIELCFTLPSDNRNASMEDAYRKGLENSFTFKIYILKRELRKTNALMLRYVILGFIFLWIAALKLFHADASVLLTLLGEGLLIGGWVFLWEAVSLSFFTNRELYNRYRTYKRLLAAPVVFRITELPL